MSGIGPSSIASTGQIILHNEHPMHRFISYVSFLSTFWNFHLKINCSGVISMLFSIESFSSSMLSLLNDVNFYTLTVHSIFSYNFNAFFIYYVKGER